MHHNLHARVANERVLVGRAHGRARIVMPLSMRQPRDVPPWWMYQCSTVCSERNSGAVHHCVHASGPLKMPLKALITVDVLVPTPLAAQPTRPRTAAMYHMDGRVETKKKYSKTE